MKMMNSCDSKILKDINKNLFKSTMNNNNNNNNTKDYRGNYNKNNHSSLVQNNDEF